MNIRLTLLLLLFLGVKQPIPSEPSVEVITCPSISSDLGNALAEVAWRSQSPMIAELAQPLPSIEIAAGTYVVRDLLQEIARQAKGYGWEMQGGVLHFFNTRLEDAKFNFLNFKLLHFITPPNLSELKLTFPMLEYGRLKGSSSQGYFISGFGDPLLEKQAVPAVTLHDITGREALIYAANQGPTFFTIIVFPNDNPSKEQMEADMNRNWWQSLREEHVETLYIKPALQ